MARPNGGKRYASFIRDAVSDTLCERGSRWLQVVVGVCGLDVVEQPVHGKAGSVIDPNVPFLKS